MSLPRTRLSRTSLTIPGKLEDQDGVLSGTKSGRTRYAYAPSGNIMKLRHVRSIAAIGLLLGSSACITSQQDEPRASAKGATARMYALQGVHFKGRGFSSVADCLTAASAEALPLEVCQ